VRGYLSGARCKLAYDPADATATHCLSVQIGFIFLVLADPGSPRKRVIKRVCMALIQNNFLIMEQRGKVNSVLVQLVIKLVSMRSHEELHLR